MALKSKKKTFVLSHGKKHDARYILFGVPDETGSLGLAKISGAKEGPNAIRMASLELSAYHRKEKKEVKTFIPNSFKEIDTGSIPLVDIGDKKKAIVEKLVATVLRNRQFPIMLGGDHSITFRALKGVGEIHKKIAVVYFDAHPDFRSSGRRKNYATVMYDTTHLPHIVNKKSVLVGIRDIEAEEFKNIKKSRVNVIKSLDIERRGIEKILNQIKKITKGLPIYISVDLDVVDPAFDPGVSSPAPGGISSNDLMFLVTELVKKDVVGLDFMELTPKRDIKRITSHFAAQLVIEFVVRDFYK